MVQLPLSIMIMLLDDIIPVVFILKLLCGFSSRFETRSTFSSPPQGVSGALAVLMRDAIKPNLMQTLEVGPPAATQNRHEPARLTLLTDGSRTRSYVPLQTLCSRWVQRQP